MGTYRLALALFVVLAHCRIRLFGINPGVVAVISFFIISGYAITKLINKNYSTPHEIIYFYTDRVLRLFPQFLFYMFLTCIAYYVMSDSEQLNAIKNILINVTMLPLNFIITSKTYHPIVPQSWSLGLEMQFYLLIPFILIFKYRAHFAIASFIAFIPAYLAFINTDLYGYRMLSGVLFIFLMGSFMADKEYKKLCVFYILSVVMLIALAWLPSLHKTWNIEVLAGIAIGVPVVLLLTTIKSGSIDMMLGNLSYGVYLNHYILKDIVARVTGLNTGFTYVVGVMGISMILSYISFKLVESPAYSFRHKIRRQKK